MSEIKATLIHKEPLPNNFKLVFRNQSGAKQFLILHENQKEIYHQLELNQAYFYTWKKGNKNYHFITPQSIRKSDNLQPSSTAYNYPLNNLEANSNPTSPQPRQTEYLSQEKNFFIKQLIKDLQLKNLSKQALFTKSEQLKNKFKRISQSDDIGFALDWIQEITTTLFLKHSQLEKEPRHCYTELEKKENQFLAELGAMFLNDWIYYCEQRESKYNQHYQTYSLQPAKTVSDSLKKLSKKQENN